MKQLVIMPGGFHPFHAGHLALYQSAKQAFPGADVKVAATNDTSARPFPFRLKEKLAQLAGVPPGKFYQVKSPFGAEEITSKYNPETTQLIFVRSEKNSRTGTNPEGPFPAEPDPKTGKLPLATRGKRKGLPVSDRLQYYQPDQPMAPMTQHAYLAYLPTVEFGPGMTSATEIRSAWPTLSPKRKSALVMSLYPATQSNPKLAANVVSMLDTAMGTEGVAEAKKELPQWKKDWYAQQKPNSWPKHPQPYHNPKWMDELSPEERKKLENQEVDEASDQTNDSDLNAIKTYARSHYPNLAADPESAFDKWVQRSLMHSNVDDHDMDQKIHRMAAEIAGLKTKIQSLKQQADDTADYLDESR